MVVASQAMAGVLSPYSAVYEISREGMVLGEVRYTLAPADGECFRFEGVAKPVGLAKFLAGNTHEESRFCVQGGKIRSQTYRISQDGGDEDENFSLNFDWAKNVVRTNDSPSRPLPDSGIDPMVLQLAVRKQLKDQNGAADRPIRVMVIENDKQKEYELTLTGEEDIKTAVGTVRTVRLERLNDRKRQLRFWLAPSLDYLPVRIERQKKDGPGFRMKLVSLPDSPAD
jgi:hypothetical protein